MFDKEKLIRRIQSTYYENVPKLIRDVAKKGPDIMRDPDIVKLIIEKDFMNQYITNVKNYIGDTWTIEEYNKLIAGNRELCINTIIKNYTTCGFVSMYFPKINLTEDLEICKALIKSNIKNAENIPCGREKVKDAILEAAQNPHTRLKELSPDFIKWMNETYTAEELASIFEKNPCHCIDQHYLKNGRWEVSIFINPDIITSKVLAKGFETAKEINNSYSHTPAIFIKKLKYFSVYGNTDLFSRLDRNTIMSIPDINSGMWDTIKAYFQPVAKKLHDETINEWAVDDKEFVLKWIAKEYGQLALSKTAPVLWYDKDVIREALIADKRFGSKYLNTEFLTTKGAIEMNLDTAIFLVRHTFKKNDAQNGSKLRRIIELSHDLTKEETGVLCKYAFSIDPQCITGIPNDMLIEIFERTFVNKQHGIKNSQDWKEKFETVHDTDMICYGQGKIVNQDREEYDYEM